MLEKGYEICECGIYAYIYATEILERLPPGYTGELCPQCGLWVCAVRHLIPPEPEEAIAPDQQVLPANEGVLPDPHPICR